MRNIVLGIMVLVIGFLVGVAYSFAVVPIPAADSGAATHAELAIERRLAAIDGQLQAIRDESRSRNRAAQRTPEPVTEQVGGDARRAKPGAPADAPRPGEWNDRLASLERWKDDAALRAKWTSASVDEFKVWFGLPHQVRVVDGTADVLTYMKKDGASVVETVAVHLAKGRVADVTVSEGR